MAKKGNKGQGEKSPESKAAKGSAYRYFGNTTWVVQDGAFLVNGMTCEALLAKILLVIPAPGALGSWGVGTCIRKFKETSRYTMTEDIVRSWLDMLIDRLWEAIWCVTYRTARLIKDGSDKDAWQTADAAQKRFVQAIAALG